MCKEVVISIHFYPSPSLYSTHLISRLEGKKKNSKDFSFESHDWIDFYSCLCFLIDNQKMKMTSSISNHFILNFFGNQFSDDFDWMQPVGCDLQLNSQLKIDGCGVCGGDGSTCDGASNKSNNNNKSDIIEEEETYRWEYGHRLSACSASCDGGKKSDQSPSSLSMSLILVNRNQSN